MTDQEPIDAADLKVVPANEAPWEDVLAVLGTADYSGRCHCQRLKVDGWIWRDSTQEQRTAAFHEQTRADPPSGLIGYLDGEPVGWVAVEARTAYLKLRTTRIPWSGRKEDKDDSEVWSVTCFVVRKGYRGRGLSYALAAATVDYARSRGARALEGYPMETQPGKEVTWGELNVGARQIFEEAGFTEVSHPTLRRYVMRIDFLQGSGS